MLESLVFYLELIEFEFLLFQEEGVIILIKHLVNILLFWLSHLVELLNVLRHLHLLFGFILFLFLFRRKRVRGRTKGPQDRGDRPRRTAAVRHTACL